MPRKPKTAPVTTGVATLPCPSCGHCPTCGRSAAPVPIHVYPYWQQPYWYWPTFAPGLTINTTSTTPFDPTVQSTATAGWTFSINES